jgi:hypothetical protein
MKVRCPNPWCEDGWIWFDKKNGGSVGKYKCERCHGEGEVEEDTLSDEERRGRNK